MTLEKTIFSGQVDNVQLPGSMGDFEVLPNHTALVSTLTHGWLHYSCDGKVYKFAIKSGVVAVGDNVVKVLC